MDIKVKKAVLKKCPSCNRLLIEGRWSKSKGKSALLLFLKKIIVAGPWQFVRILPEDALSSKMQRKVDVIISLEDEDYEQVTIPLKAANTFCDDCAKSQGQYFEGFLQIRNADSMQMKHSRELLEEKGAIKKEKVKGGNANFTVSSNKAVVHAIRELSKKYVGISEITTKLHTKDNLTSKEIHRVTGLYRFISLKKNDAVMHNESYYLIRGIDSKIIMLEGLSKKAVRKNIPLSEHGSLRKIESFETTIIRKSPVLMVLDKNYQPQTAIARTSIQSDKRTYRAVDTDEGIFIMPDY